MLFYEVICSQQKNNNKFKYTFSKLAVLDSNSTNTKLSPDLQTDLNLVDISF